VDRCFNDLQILLRRQVAASRAKFYITTQRSPTIPQLIITNPRIQRYHKYTKAQTTHPSKKWPTKAFNVEDATEYAKCRHQLLDPTTEAGSFQHGYMVLVNRFRTSTCTKVADTFQVIMDPANTELFEEWKQNVMNDGYIVIRDPREYHGQ
jgi:hypothetical protein